MADILSAMSSIFTTVVSMLTSLCTTIVGQPILLLFVIFALSMVGISVFKRLAS